MTERRKQRGMRILAWLLLVCLAVLPLFACGEQGEGSGTTGSAGGGTKPSGAVTEAPSGTGGNNGDDGKQDPEATVFGTDLLEKLKIVYRQGAGDDIIGAAGTLADAIKASFGVKPAVTSDYLRENSETYCEYEYEILVGTTNREVSAQFESLRADDYLYTSVGKKIVLIGGNDYATAQAVNDFTYDIVVMKKGKGEVFFRSDWTKETKKSYTVENLTLQGESIRSYSIVYPRKGTAWEKGLAEHLAYRLEALTGYAIPVKSDAKAYADDWEIVIGKTSRTAAEEIAGTATEARQGVVGATGKLVVLAGADTYSMKVAIDELLSDMEAAIDKDRNVSAQVTETRRVSAPVTVDSMTFNLQTWNMGTERNARAVRMIQTYLPDVIGVQEANSLWMTILEEELGSYYTIIGEGREPKNQGERTAILLAKSRFEVEESGTRWLTDTPTVASKLPGAEYYRIYSYAVLRDLVSGERFLHVNTHLDTASDSVRSTEVNMLFEFLRGYQNLPVLLTGDLNASVSSSPIKMLTSGGLTSTDAMYEGRNATPTIDWLFVTADCVRVTYYRVCNERVNGDYPSDHYPVLSRLEFFTPEGGIHHDFDTVLPSAPDGCLQPDRDTEGEDMGPIHRIF